MRSIYAALAFVIMMTVTTVVTASTFAKLQNRGGGYIYLTNQECRYPMKNTFIVYTRVKSGDTFFGCWNLLKDPGLVIVKWADGEVSTYPLDHFRRMEQ